MTSDPNKTILGYAEGSEDDSRVEIMIDPNAWNRLSDLEKTTLLYHELSHDILNASHVDDGDHLMHPSNIYGTTVELVNGLIGILVEYREGTLQKFN